MADKFDDTLRHPLPFSTHYCPLLHINMRTVITWNGLLKLGEASDFFTRRNFPPFEATTRSYSTANALWLAELSRLVYHHDIEEDTPPPQPTQTYFLEQAGCTRRQFFHSRKTGTQAMLVEFNIAMPYAVLVFRGTEQRIKDVITDLTIGTLHTLTSPSSGNVETSWIEGLSKPPKFLADHAPINYVEGISSVRLTYILPSRS